jgi:hypothetical protein
VDKFFFFFFGEAKEGRDIPDDLCIYVKQLQKMVVYMSSS